MAKRLWFVRTRRIVTQYGITDLRARLAAALWELRRLRRELPVAQQGERLPDYDVTNWLGDDGQIHWSED